MTLIDYKIFAALLIFLAGIAATIYPLKKRRSGQPESVELGEALASGIFLGAAFFHMLPESINLYAQVYGNNYYPIPEMICVLGFLILLFLERLSITTQSLSPQNSIPYIFAIILIIHALSEGAALGIGGNFSEAFILFIAIIAHKGSESFALCLTMLRHQLPYRRILIIITLFSLMTPVGVVAGTYIMHTIGASDRMVIAAATLNAFAAGTFLYISTLHHIHFHKHAQDSRGMLEFVFLVGGILTMGISSIWA